MVVTEPTLVLHVEAGHHGPEDGGEERGQPAHHQVDPVVVGGVVEEDIHHQDIVQVETLNKYFISLHCSVTLEMLLSPPETSSETSQSCCIPTKSTTIDKQQSSKGEENHGNSMSVICYTYHVSKTGK